MKQRWVAPTSWLVASLLMAVFFFGWTQDAYPRPKLATVQPASALCQPASFAGPACEGVLHIDRTTSPPTPTPNATGSD